MFQRLEDHLFLEFACSHQGINHRDNLNKGTCWNVDYFNQKRQEAKPKFMKRRRFPESMDVILYEFFKELCKISC